MNRSGRLFALILLLASLGSFTGCSSKIQSAGIRDTTQRVLDRHDAYLVADESLDSESRSPSLGQSSQVRELLKKDEIQAREIEPSLLPVLDRHDGYVQKDESLEAVEKRTALRSSRILRSVLDEARR